MSPFDIINIINEKKEHDTGEVLADYAPFIVNRGLSNTMDTLFFAAEMSKYAHLGKDVQFAFYLNGIPKGKRFGKWNKPPKAEDIELINKVCNAYSVNEKIAKRYLTLLSEEAKSAFLNSEGGKHGRTKNRGTD